MIIEEIIKYNEQFVANKGYEKYLTSKYPYKTRNLLSCLVWIPDLRHSCQQPSDRKMEMLNSPTLTVSPSAGKT